MRFQLLTSTGRPFASVPFHTPSGSPCVVGAFGCILAGYARVVLFSLPKSLHQDAQFYWHRSRSRAISLDLVWAGSEQRFLANAFPRYAHLQTLHTSSAICAQTTAIATLRETIWPAFLSSGHRRY